MTYVALATLILQFAFSIWNYFMGDEVTKKAAIEKLTSQFQGLEEKGFPILKDILAQANRSNWAPWASIPTQSEPESFKK